MMSDFEVKKGFNLNDYCFGRMAVSMNVVEENKSNVVMAGTSVSY